MRFSIMSHSRAEYELVTVFDLKMSITFLVSHLAACQTNTATTWGSQTHTVEFCIIIRSLRAETVNFAG